MNFLTAPSSKFSSPRRRGANLSRRRSRQRTWRGHLRPEARTPVGSRRCAGQARERPAAQAPGGWRCCACQARGCACRQARSHCALHHLAGRRGHDPLRRCGQAVSRIAAGQLLAECQAGRLPRHSRRSVEQNRLRYHAEHRSCYAVMSRLRWSGLWLTATRRWRLAAVAPLE